MWLKYRITVIYTSAIRPNSELAGGDGYEQTIQAVIDSTPLQKAADPADIADAVLGIIEGSDMLTGQILLVDGGQNI